MKTSNTMNLRQRLLRYLRNHPDTWVSSQKLHALASKEGYLYEATEDALEAITHIPPYAFRSVSKDDTRRDVTPGRYYCYHTIDSDTLESIKRGNAYFDSL